jgi:hypothetical protein
MAATHSTKIKKEAELLPNHFWILGEIHPRQRVIF